MPANATVDAEDDHDIAIDVAQQFGLSGWAATEPTVESSMAGGGVDPAMGVVAGVSDFVHARLGGGAEQLVTLECEVPAPEVFEGSQHTECTPATPDIGPRRYGLADTIADLV